MTRRDLDARWVRVASFAAWIAATACGGGGSDGSDPGDASSPTGSSTSGPGAGVGVGTSGTAGTGASSTSAATGTGGSGPTSGTSATSTSGTSMASGSGGATTSSGAGGAAPDSGVGGAGGSADAGSDAGTKPVKPATPADFEGIDLTKFPTTKVDGCTMFDKATGTLTLKLGTVNNVYVDANLGKIRANSNICTAADGTLVTTTSLKSLVITGSPSNDYVVIDLLLGPFAPSFLSTAGSMKIDLGGGIDTVAVRATGGDDRFVASGAQGPGSGQVDFGYGPACMRVDNIEFFLFSLGPGNDFFSGGGINPVAIPITVYGGADDDSIAGGLANDVLNGGPGNDNFDEGSQINGADVMNGGADVDGISYGSRTNRVTITLCSSTVNTACTAPCVCTADDGESGEKDLIVNVENAEGGGGNDLIVGDANPNILSGKGGNDQISGGDGPDQVFGDDGDDVISGGADDDILTGGTGSDRIDGEVGTDICFYDRDDATRNNCEVSIPQ